MLIYLIAGEPSGDMLGAKLMRALRKENPKVRFAGVGGENMEKEGLKSLFNISDLSVMGLAEVIPSIPKILGHIKNTVEDIILSQPEAVITIDSWSFSERIHKALKKRKVNTYQMHYVAPQVWAWKPKRAETMHKYIDHLLTLFPNEPAYFTPHHLKADYVGHPAIENPYLNASPMIFKEKYNIPADKKMMLILPGSRHNEVNRLLPVFLQTAKMMKERFKNLCFVLPTVKTVEATVKSIVAESGMEDILFVTNSDDRHLAMRAATAAMAASGTVSLELALCKTPHIIAYKVAPLTAWMAKHFLKIKSVNLPNLIMGRYVIKELLQEECTPTEIFNRLSFYLGDNSKPYRSYFKTAISPLRRLMGVGELKPSEKAAEIILTEIKQRGATHRKRKA